MSGLQETTQDFHFPKAGLDRSGPFGRQPVREGKYGVYVRTAADGVNVRSFESLTGRDRGGSRGGLSKYVPARVNDAAWVVQNLATLSTTERSIPAVQQSNSGRVVYLLAVSQGVLKVTTPGETTWTTAANATGETPPLNFSGVMQSTSVNQKQYFCDGTNYCVYKPASNTIETWTPTLGSLPRDSENNGARLVCTWRGRAVLSGLLKDPQNWFMSRVSDPLDFEYGHDPVTKTDAVAGNNSPLGLIGDVVTALIPYSDDILIFGGDHTVYMMKGDPADGGQVDLVSDITGIAFGKAWCKDPYGNVYFFGSKPSVWRMSGANSPERISQPIEPLLKDIDTGNSVITMAWNDRQQAVHVFVTAADAPASCTHYVYEARAGAWWKDTHADDNLNPLCCVAFDGNEADDRALLVGGWDGYVRFLDPSATTDDGTAISSSVLIGPILTQELDEMLLKEIQLVMAANSGEVSYDILAASTAEEAVAAAARFSGTASAGRNSTQPCRVAGHAIYIKISATTHWAMESIRAVFAGRNKVRRRKPT
jgi:hypothetical protein